MKTSKGKFHLGNLVLSMLTIFMFICYAIHFAALRVSTHKDENNNTVINFDSVNVRNDFLAYPFNNDTKVTNDNVQNVLDASLVIFSIFYMALIWLLVYKNEDNNSI